MQSRSLPIAGLTDALREGGSLMAEQMPLSLRREQAARLCGISVHTFDDWVRKNILPKPIPGTRRWSRLSIEHALGQVAVANVSGQPSPFEAWQHRSAA
jgi:predicted DNA-binding transcriptional regulator AlpA